MEFKSEELWKTNMFSVEAKVIARNYSSKLLQSERINIDRKLIICSQDNLHLAYPRASNPLQVSVSIAIYCENTDVARQKFYDHLKFSHKIAGNILHMLDDSIFSDFTFIVGGREFKVHKNILAASSPVFMDLFTTAMATAEDSHRIEEIKPEFFQCLLRFIYGGELPANISEVSLKLFEVAHHYQIDELIDICKIEIEAKLSVDNAIDIYQIAQVYDLEDLKFTVWKFIKRWVICWFSHGLYLLMSILLGTF